MDSGKKDKKTEREERRKKLLELRADEVQKLNTGTRERLIYLIWGDSPSSGRYEYLEKRYGISGRRWQNVFNRAQLPGIDMLSSVIMGYPQYSTWLMTGKAISATQINPLAELQLDQEIDLDVKGWEQKIENVLWERMRENSLKKTNP